jgi:hypothetical protein
MKNQCLFPLVARRFPFVAAVVVFGAFSLTLATPTRATADEPRSKAASGGGVATCVSETATLVRRPSGETTWQIVKGNESLPAGDLLVGLPGAILDSKNGAVRAELLADLDRLSPFPIRECALRLQENAGVDLAVTLDRGRVEFINRKKSGPATVRVSVRQDTWDIQLKEPGTEIALELYGRWPAGVPFSTKPGANHEPTASLLFLVLRGHVLLKHKDEELALRAPPGPALVEWDSVTGQDDSAQRLDTLPPWADPARKETALAKKKLAVIERFRQAAVAKSIDGALDEFVNSDNQYDRTLAIFAMAALDQLGRLGKAVRETKHPDVLEDAVLALRHWIGRCPGQDQILYNRLIEVAKYQPVHAETVLQLLHSFGEADLASPETYQTLIDYLDHEHLAIRELAYWHLYRLVQAGREIAYNPLDRKEAREAAIQKWRKLLPPGKLPARPKGGKD